MAKEPTKPPEPKPAPPSPQPTPQERIQYPRKPREIVPNSGDRIMPTPSLPTIEKK